jgi:hypothetical protein
MGLPSMRSSHQIVTNTQRQCNEGQHRPGLSVFMDELFDFVTLSKFSTSLSLSFLLCNVEIILLRCGDAFR